MTTSDEINLDKELFGANVATVELILVSPVHIKEYDISKQNQYCIADIHQKQRVLVTLNIIFSFFIRHKKR